jgi:hypothetical protein
LPCIYLFEKDIDMAKQGRINKNQSTQRIYEVYKDLVEMYTVADIKKKYSELWNCSEQNINWYISQAYKIFDSNMEKEFAKLANNQISRLMNIGCAALQRGDLSNAIKATDIINKLGGLYTEKVEANVKADTTIQVNFGGFTVDSNNDDEEDTVE